MAYEERLNQYAKFKDVVYYIIIAVISFASVAFLPFIGSAIAGTFMWPQGGLEWAIWITGKLLVSIINVLIFYSFLSQGKVNIKNDKRYLEALEILGRVQQHQKRLKPRSPSKYFGKIWASKGTTLFITSALSAMVLAEALLVFDLATFLSYVFTVLLAIVFGFLQMLQTEEY